MCDQAIKSKKVCPSSKSKAKSKKEKKSFLQAVKTELHVFLAVFLPSEGFSCAPGAVRKVGRVFLQMVSFYRAV